MEQDEYIYTIILSSLNIYLFSTLQQRLTSPVFETTREEGIHPLNNECYLFFTLSWHTTKMP